MNKCLTVSPFINVKSTKSYIRPLLTFHLLPLTDKYNRRHTQAKFSLKLFYLNRYTRSYRLSLIYMLTHACAYKLHNLFDACAWSIHRQLSRARDRCLNGMSFLFINILFFIIFIIIVIFFSFFKHILLSFYLFVNYLFIYLCNYLCIY